MEIGFFDPEEPIDNLTGNLPHWRQENVTYFVTFRTADSIPKIKLDQWEKEKKEWLKTHPEPHDKSTKAEFYQNFPDRINRWLDNGYGECLLKRTDVKSIVENALRFFHGDRYLLDRFVVMPNHVHALVTPLGSNNLSAILHSWKSFTGNEINRILGRHSPFWQKESFDHIVRSERQLERIRRYIEDNPKKDVDAASSRVMHEPEHE